jgi:hypothetical protein
MNLNLANINNRNICKIIFTLNKKNDQFFNIKLIIIRLIILNYIRTLLPRGT